jgi:hypothetical protein
MTLDSDKADISVSWERDLFFDARVLVVLSAVMWGIITRVTKIAKESYLMMLMSVSIAIFGSGHASTIYLKSIYHNYFSHFLLKFHRPYHFHFTITG